MFEDALARAWLRLTAVVGETGVIMLLVRAALFAEMLEFELNGFSRKLGRENSGAIGVGGKGKRNVGAAGRVRLWGGRIRDWYFGWE